MRAVLFFLLLIFAGPAFGQAGGPDQAFLNAVADRGKYGKMVFLFGDSLPRGYALSAYADAVSPSHPLYNFRSISSMANWALQLNDRKEIFAYGGGLSVSNITTYIASGVIRSGDAVVVIDAGKHTDMTGTTSGDPDIYEAMIADLRAAATEKHDITFVAMSMFEYCHSSNLACDSRYQYDTVFGSRSINDATQDAATADQSFVGQALFIDMNAKMDQWRNSALSVDGAEVMILDGIHPNVWGQMRLTREIMKAAGLAVYITDVTAMRDLAAANYTALSYGSSTFTASRASVYAHTLMVSY